MLDRPGDGRVWRVEHRGFGVVHPAASLTGVQMNPDQQPKAFGVSKPVGHVVVSFPTRTDLEGARAELLDLGFADADLTVFTPEEMVAQADIDIDNAGILANVGQELNLVKANRDLALRGHGFLIVRASDDEPAQQVADVARRFNAGRAQKYGRMMIEELIEVGSGERQVAESPDRGLDAQTPSGVEADGNSTRR
ncbi:MAG: hypothetical protein ABIQ60_06545 [Burkholderiaceae bacterium]